MTANILASDLFRIREYKELKVFLLIGLKGDELVIKTDAVSAQQIKSASVAAKAISHNSRMKILTDSERRELELYCKYFEELDAYYQDIGVASPFRDQKDAVKNLKDSLGFGFPFGKMIKERILDLQGAMEQRGSGAGGGKDIVRQFVSTLNAEGGLEMLGKVVAGDLFNGNSDRFFPGTNKDLKCGPFNVRLKTLVNPGNAMIIATQGGFTVSMLDYVDPQSRFKNINESLAAAEKDGEWPGRTLADKTKRHKFAKEIIENLEAVLHPKKSMFSMKTKLGRDSVKRLEKGMMEGARLIKSRLEMKFNPNRWTPGAKERYMVIFKV